MSTLRMLLAVACLLLPLTACDETPSGRKQLALVPNRQMAEKNSGWLLGFGILSVILGNIGSGMTPYLTMAGVSCLGILLAVGTVSNSSMPSGAKGGRAAGSTY